MTSPATGVGEVAPAAVGPGPVPLPDAEPAAAAAPASVLDPEPADPPSAAEPSPAPASDPAPASSTPEPTDDGPALPSDQSPPTPLSVDTPTPVPAPPSDPVPAPVPAPPSDPVPAPSEARSSDQAPPPEPAPEPEPAPAAPAPLAAALPVRPVRRIPASGERLGRFTLAEALGHGGFAHVYRAVADDDTEVALKVLTGLHDDARDRFAQEAHLLERLDGRGFPRFVEAGLDADQPWFAMELVPGTTLRDRVREEGPLSGHEALGLAKQLVDALLVLQEERALHRDLKPANIMVDGDRAVLIDLGIAKVFDAATSTQPAGTVSYMAPELFGRRVHPRSDVYSLGLLLLYANTGTLPLDLNFLGRDLVPTDLVDEEPLHVVPDDDPLPEPPAVDRHLQSLILAMTRYQPNHRPPLENIASVVRARLASTTPDPTLMLTSQLLSDGVTAAEVAALPATDVLPGRGHTKLFQRDPDRSDTPTPSRVTEPWHALVYDRALMSVLAEVHADGFDGAAEQVVADHVAEIGAHVADGRTPAEIKDWIWQAMRWQVASPPDGHADTLRGWRAFRSPEPVPASEQVPARSRPEPVPPAVVPGSAAPAPAAATQVVRRLVPPPQSFEPRKSPVKHLGPAPKQAGPKQSAHATRPMPVTPPAVQQQPASRPPSVQPGIGQGIGQSTQQNARQRFRQGIQRGVRPAAQPAAQPVAQPRVRPAPQPVVAARPTAPAAAAPRRRPWPLRLLGALLRWVPRLLLLGAVYLLVTQDAQAGDPYLAAPALAVAALGLAALLRIGGHAMRIWFYVVSTLLVGVGSAALWATSSTTLQLGY
ncbi:serine/threonine-protein kinase [Promicromonospora iranensis]|uniref:Serine/threonine protein kinase n=1 Tax=Promicromonospora iranensis TaxID=1105144 RepID=A0ABU2CHM5_9MICO|nr:serine/threonine-protein kinase [Promicromonospora iranensis]MDR7380836.1 serine/threonine protein kinase [Promicromonospora iranensis]